MSEVFDGVGAAEGIADGPIHLLNWGVPDVPHRTISSDEIEGEVERFREALSWAEVRLEELKERTAARLGSVEARIFDPQMLMLQDAELVDRVIRYISDNRLGAARALSWRILELHARWSRTAHPMVLDRLNDLEDLQVRLLHRLLGMSDPTDVTSVSHGAIVVASNLTPSLIVQMDLTTVLGIAADQGTRTAHWVMLARSLEIPTVCGIGSISKKVKDGQEAIIDGRLGRVVVDPDEADRAVFSQRESQIQRWEGELDELVRRDTVTADGTPISLRANLDLPDELPQAVAHGAQGVGLFRTEFLVVGRRAMPVEDDQYQAYRRVAETFPSNAVVIRTFDLGGDKFPMFLHMPEEENPFLGWRAIRVCLDVPELFRTQLRAILRASVHGDIRIMVPLVNDVEEIRQVRAILQEEEERLLDEGIPFNSGYKLGILMETPAAALEAVELSRYCDFFSIGTNDLTQYTLAVDRTSAKLAKLFNPFHPAVVRQLSRIARVGRSAGIEVSVCGEMAANPLGAFLFLGLDITALSVAWPSLPEVKQFLLQMRVEDARRAARAAVEAPTSAEVIEALVDGIGDSVDLSRYPGRWNLSLSEGSE
jgi:phosphoenolpyruvate-protein phosphotransferase (PTS system enzyme I)